jgi:hypothetical protein
MTKLQARLLAGRAVRAAQAQEKDARRLRPTGGVPSQRPAADPAAPQLSVVKEPADAES